MMLINFEKVILHNFGSYAHTELMLQNRGFCSVSGKNNYSKDNAISNGSGKSFLWSGICFALTGETIQGLHSNLKNINIDEDLSYTSVYFKYNNDSYIVTRYIAPHSDLKIIQNGVDISGKGLRESEKKFGEILPDLSKDLIASSILIGQGMPAKFSSFSPSGRKELLEKLTKSDFMIEDIRNRVSTRQTTISNELRINEDGLLINRTKLDTTSANLEAAKKELKNAIQPDFDGIISKSTKLCESISNDIKRVNTERDTAFANYTNANNSLVELAKKQQDEFSEELAAYSEASSNTKIEKNAAELKISQLTAEITRLKNIKDICPTCGQKLPNVIKPDTSKLETELAETQAKLSTANTKLGELNKKHAEYTTQITEKYKTNIAKLTQEKDKHQFEVGRLKDTINDFSHNLDIEKEQLLKAKTDKANWDKYISGLKATIDKLEFEETTISNLIKVLNDSHNILSERQAILKKMETLIKRDYRGFILSNIIAYIDKKAKEYSKIVFGTEDLKVYLDGNALDISYCDKLIDNLSGGEKQRVDLILQLAIRDLLNNYFNFSSNILVLDEVTDFLDAKSCQAVMTLLNTVLTDIESVFIISHHAESLDLAFDSEITVTKNENGISEIL